MCATEKRNEILKKPILRYEDVQVLFDCTKEMSYKYIEIINKWLTENGKTPLVAGKTKIVRTVDYIDFAGLPRELML